MSSGKHYKPRGKLYVTPAPNRWVFLMHQASISEELLEMEIRSIECPTCSAPPGEACFDTIGLSTHPQARWAYSHWRRHEQYLKEQVT